MILKYFTRSFLVIAILVAPVVSRAALVTCGVGDAAPCTFPDFFVLLNTIMEFLVVTVAVPLAVITIVYGGIIITIYASYFPKHIIILLRKKMSKNMMGLYRYMP